MTPFQECTAASPKKRQRGEMHHGYLLRILVETNGSPVQFCDFTRIRDLLQSILTTSIEEDRKKNNGTISSRDHSYEQALPSSQASTLKACKTESQSHSYIDVSDLFPKFGERVHAIENKIMLDRLSIRTASVIGQVHEKFVACLVNKNQIVLVDQHAAHERIRLEYLLGKYFRLCSQHGEMVSKPLGYVVEISASIGDLLRNSDTLSALKYWGFQILFEQQPYLVIKRKRKQYYSVLVKTVPYLLHSRFKQQPELVTQLIIEIAAWIESGHALRQADASRSAMLRSSALKESQWMMTLWLLPTFVIDLFASVACRGAISRYIAAVFVYSDYIHIVFNDRLSIQQARCVLQQLARTTFPSRCAHGRYVTTSL